MCPLDGILLTHPWKEMFPRTSNLSGGEQGDGHLNLLTALESCTCLVRSDLMFAGSGSAVLDVGSPFVGKISPFEASRFSCKTSVCCVSMFTSLAPPFNTLVHMSVCSLFDTALYALGFSAHSAFK